MENKTPKGAIFRGLTQVEKEEVIQAAKEQAICGMGIQELASLVNYPKGWTLAGLSKMLTYRLGWKLERGVIMEGPLKTLPQVQQSLPLPPTDNNTLQVPFPSDFTSRPLVVQLEWLTNCHLAMATILMDIKEKIRQMNRSLALAELKLRETK